MNSGLFSRRGAAARLPLALLVSSLVGCAIQTPSTPTRESQQSQDAQLGAQRAVSEARPSTPVLKRKIAIGRVTNETSYGQSLLRDRMDDPLGKQTADLLSKNLT